MTETQASEETLKTIRGIVYCIWNQVTNRRYIGKTSRTFWGRYTRGRWWKHSQNNELKDDYKKYGHKAFIVYLLAQNITTDHELLLIEASSILKMQTMHPKGYNLLYTYDDLTTVRWTIQANQNALKGKNQAGKQMILPGILSPRRCMPIEFCEEHSKRMSGQGNPMYGKKFTDITKNKIRQKALGRKVSLDTRLKMSKRRGSLHPRSKKVQQIDIVTGSVIQQYGSAREAARIIGASPSCITAVCTGEEKTSKGFYWKYTS